MGFSARFVYNVMSVFNTLGNVYTPQYIRTSLNDINMFRTGLLIKGSDNEIEVPVIARMLFEREVTEAGNPLTEIEKMVLPLYNNSPNSEVSTFSAMMSLFANNVSYNDRLMKITTREGEIYYGSRGIILDEDYTPLLLCTLRAKVSEDNSTVIYYRPVCHISPKVFLEPKKFVNKNIIRKLIPCYINSSVNPLVLTYLSFEDGIENRKVKIVIGDLDKFFVKPIKPVPSDISNDALNTCLVDNIDDIMALI